LPSTFISTVPPVASYRSRVTVAVFIEAILKTLTLLNLKLYGVEPDGREVSGDGDEREE